MFVMSDINLHPENDPGGHFGETLHTVAADLSRGVQPYVEASDVAAFAAAERGEQPLPNDEVAELVLGLEGTINAIGAMYQDAQSLFGKITNMTPNEFEAAKSELQDAAPTYDWAGLYERNRKREPGKIGSFFRPALRVLGLEPPYWR